MKTTLYWLGALLPFAIAAPTSDTNEKSTLTYTATKTLTDITTVTTNSTVYTTTTYTRPFGLPSYSYIYNDTITTTGTSTASTYTTIQPSVTTSSPTQAGFTALRKESVYTDEISIVRVTITSTSTATFDPSPTTMPGNFVMVYPPVSFTSTSTMPSYVYSSTTVTSTSTAMPSIHVDYDACGPDNLAKTIPTGQFLDSTGEYGQYDYDVTFTDNAVDCCGHCQEVGGCFGGTWETGPQADFPGRCFVFTLNKNDANQTCDGSVGRGLFGHSPGTNNSATTAFNGPCGQLSWQFQSADYF